MLPNFFSQYSGNEKISPQSTVHFDNWLGTGAFGMVFDCTFQKGNTQILACAKVMSRKDIPPKMLNMEILALKTLQGAENENIVKIYEIVKRDKDMDIFIIMEKCSEGDLNFYRKHRQDQNLPFEPLKVKKLITDIANAYKACIKSGIIHRDIKPANILIRNNMFLLTDFGMSCIIDGIGKRRHLTRLGSPFAAPQILHDNPYSNKCDVYSLGVVAFLLLFNHYPVDGADENELKRNLMEYRTKDFKCPEKPKINPKMKGLIESMLQYEEEKRIGWTELIDNKWLKQKIELTDTDPQEPVQVQVQANQQNQPDYEFLVTRIGPELVDEDTTEDSLLAQIKSHGPQQDLLSPDQPSPKKVLGQNQMNQQFQLSPQPTQQIVPSEETPTNHIYQQPAYVLTQKDLTRLFNFIEIFLAKAIMADGTCKQIMVNQQCTSSLSKFEFQGLKTTLLGYSYQAVLNAHGMVHNVPQCIGGELRELLTQNNNLHKFFYIMDTYSTQLGDHLSRQISVIKQMTGKVRPEYTAATMEQYLIKDQCPARWSNFIPGLIEFTPGYHFFMEWFSAFYGEIQQRAHNFREQPRSFINDQSVEYIRCIYLCHRFKKLDAEFPLFNHRNIIINISSITGMLQETSKELMINYILA